jgi:Large-conductance mechanosensitive channel, MscL
LTDFSNYYLPLSATVKAGLALVDAKKAGAVLAYGNFITATLNFLIIAFVLFLAIQDMNRLKKTEETQPAASPAPTTSEKLPSCLESSGTGRPLFNPPSSFLPLGHMLERNTGAYQECPEVRKSRALLAAELARRCRNRDRQNHAHELR